MKKLFAFLSIISISFFSHGQSSMKQHTVGHPIYVSIPEYMSRTIGLNEDAIFQYKSEVKDVYGYVIEDNKEELKLAELNYASLNEFYDEFIKGFIEGEEKVNVSKPIAQKKGDISFIEVDVSFYSKEAKTEIFYMIGIVETSKAYYKVLSYCTLENKAKFKADFQKIIYSLKD